MTWVALIFTPVVLAYQAWTYWVFRHRVGGTPVTSPLEALSHGKPPAGGGCARPQRPVRLAA